MCPKPRRCWRRTIRWTASRARSSVSCSLTCWATRRRSNPASTSYSSPATSSASAITPPTSPKTSSSSSKHGTCATRAIRPLNSEGRPSQSSALRALSLSAYRQMDAAVQCERLADRPHGRAADVVIHVEEILEAEIGGPAVADWPEDSHVGDRPGIEDERVAVVLELAAEGAN